MEKSGLCIVFGTGPLGFAVAEKLIEKGKTVKMANRTGKGAVPKGAKLVKADATDLERTREVCSNAKFVFHCAMPVYTNWPELFPILSYGILEGAASAGAKLIYADNLYMYGAPEEPIHEESSINLQGAKGKVRAEMAEKLLEHHKSGRVKVTIGRASDFYGPRVVNSILGERVFKPAIEGKSITMIGNLDVPHTYTYIKDFANALVTLAENYNSYGETWIVPSAETITTREIIHLIFNETKKTPKVKSAPSFIIKLMSIFNPVLKEIQEVIPSYQKAFVVNHNKFEKVFGANTTPHKIAIKETVNWYKQHFRL